MYSNKLTSTMNNDFPNLRQLLGKDVERYEFFRDITVAEILTLEQFPVVQPPYVGLKRQRLFEEMCETNMFSDMVFEEPPTEPTNWKNDIDLLALYKFKLLNTNK